MHNKRVPQKSKNFIEAMKRLLKELKSFHVVIVIALFLAITGSILSIISPNRVSKLTDTISEGLVVKTDNMTKLNKTIMDRLSKIDGKEILSNDTLSEEDKKSFLTVMSNNQESKNIIASLDKLSPNIIQIIFPDYVIAKQKITSQEQVTYLKLIKDLDKNTKPEVIYQKIDEMPYSIQKVIKPYMDINKIKKLVLILVVIYLVSALFNFIESILMTDVSNNFAKGLRTRISVKINKLPLKYFDNNRTGDILSRVTNDVDTIAQTMNQSLAMLVSSITLFLGTIIMMFYTNWIMAITAILASLIGFVFMFMILSKSQKYFVDRQVELGKLNSHIEEVYSGLLVVKAYNGKKESDLKFDEYNKKVYEANRKSQFLSGLMMPVMHFIGNFGYVAVCIVGALLTMNNVITFGVIVAFITYVRLFTSPLSQIAQAMNALQSTAAASERV